MWSKGIIDIPTPGGSTTTAYYEVKHYEEPSEFGINGGKISKLYIELGKTIAARYDRGWDLEPSTQQASIALYILLEKYN